ncbi:LytTR family transcriptional regulator DNA-binding domain-containing protein [Tissierella sp. MSJ-40]|uniref:LytTR family transcriptional regulator DNA-binding domain-containing protein n=1 Tax=Tissierella simiarum TaxID=2841534 RepID=A0ABS6E9A8_9FIRM|nr:LytTR family DNA-binding domain-containing protein [Tissierella simiarum]MBU5439513.1 LytTR family transcriptional regulator DNA-binding domain-containing protein [Tissierella simiarum]
MKVNYYEDKMIEENRVDVFYSEKDREILGIMNYLQSYEIILGKNEKLTKKILPNDIFYLETVERRCYAYLESEVYQIDFNLKNFQERFLNNGFIQIGKSMIVNVYKIDRVKTDSNMRMRLIMENGEVLILNRTFKKNFMEYLRNIQEVENEDYR